MMTLPKRIRNLPLKQKLILSFMATSITSLALVCLIFIINDYLTERKDMLNGAAALADTIGKASSDAVAFDDSITASEILQAFNAHPNIDMAALYRKDGSEIASYVRKGSGGRPASAESFNKSNFDLDKIHISRSLNLEGEHIGRIYLSYDLSSLASRQLRFISLVLFVLVLVSCLTYLAASRLTIYISKPIQNLAVVAHNVSLKQDYSIRAECLNVDEIGILSDSFNNMLAQIQERDRQLVLHHEQLEEQVAKRTCELKTANELLSFEIAERTKAENDRNLMEDELLKSRKLESIGVLAGGIAHDFNNILTSIVGFISVARNRTKDDEKVQDFLKNAEKGCFRAKNLTQQLLTFSSGGKPVRKIISLASVIREAIDISMVSSNVISNIELSDKLHPVEVDTGQIVQVLNNLLINACQAMPNGGKVTIKADNVHIDNPAVLPMPPGEYVIIVVEDTGCGIAGENLHRIFDPYFSTKPMGNGLGLATCYSIIRNHGGMISVASELEKGTSFSIYLPAAKTGITL